MYDSNKQSSFVIENKNGLFLDLNFKFIHEINFGFGMSGICVWFEKCLCQNRQIESENLDENKQLFCQYISVIAQCQT